MKLSELADTYVNGALHMFLTLQEKSVIVEAARKNPEFLKQSVISSEDAKDRRLVAFLILTTARDVVKNAPLN